jgi:glycosyltransferase involved in cell wall biosynthesis
MRIALLHPTYWPEVLRGSERIVHDLGAELASRGHEVSLITSHRRRASVSEEEGMRVIRARRPPRPPGAGAYEHHLVNAPNVWRRLRGGRFDVVHAFFPVDAWVAVRLRQRGGPPVVATLHGIPTRQYLVARRYRLEMLRAGAAGADECTVLSAAAADPFRRYLFREPRVLPPGVLADRYRSDVPRAAEPTIVCAATLGDPRKRGSLLAAAFARLRAKVPGARLLVLRGRDPILSGAVPALGEGAEWVDPVREPEDLAPLYAGAWASVLPSVEEAFGVVLTESLAAGTPVVADRSGAGPEIVTDDRVGRLFNGDDEADLARAMEEAVELGSRPETAELCRARAADYDWSRVVARYEDVYDSVKESSSTNAGSGGASTLRRSLTT